MRASLLILALLMALCLSQTSSAQFELPGEKPTPSKAGSPSSNPSSGTLSDKGIKFDTELVQRWKVGLTLIAAGPCKGIFATVPVPTNWPEQSVKIIKEEFSPGVKVSYRNHADGGRQMLIRLSSLAAGTRAVALVTYEIRRKSILAPQDPTIFRVPEKVTGRMRKYIQPSPLIESRDAKIRAIAKKIGGEGESAWKRVEAMYDWVRDNVEYKTGLIKGAKAALKDGDGDCEELTSLFVAMCRANGIPARSVWIPGHCYPEFYLEDDEGTGHWIPCQAAGTRAFGSMPDYRLVLQKGDSFKVPEHRKTQRYMAEFLKVKSTGSRPPRHRVVRISVPLDE